MGNGWSDEDKNVTKATDNLIATIQGHENGINCMSISKNGMILVTAGDDKIAKVWDAREGRNFRRMGKLIGHQGYITCILIENSFILTGSSDKTVIKWDVERDFEISAICRGHVSLIQRMICTGQFIFTSSFDHTARCFDFDGGECLRLFKGHKRGVYPLMFIPVYEEDDFEFNDGSDNELGVLITGSADGTARSWNCDSGARLKVFKGILIILFRNILLKSFILLLTDKS